MKLTLKQIKDHGFREKGLETLIKYINEKTGEECISILTILESNGLNDAI